MLRLALLWWKDWKWQKKNFGLDIALLLIPVLFSIVLTVFQFGDFSVHHYEKAIVAHERLLKTSKHYVPPFKYEVFFPSKAGKEEFREFGSFCWSYCKGFKKRTYNNIDDVTANSSYSGLVLIEEWNVAAPLLKYRIVDRRWSLQKSLAPYWGLWSVDQLSTERTQADSAAALVQKLIDAHFYSRRALLTQKINATGLEKRGDLRGILDMVVHHSAMPLFNPSTASVAVIIGQIISFSSLLGVWRTTKQIEAEREARTKVLLYELGIGRLQYFGAFTIPLFVKFFLMQILVWIPPFIGLQNAFDVPVVLAGTILYSVVLVSFSLLMSVIFRSQLAAKIGSTVLMVFLHLGQISQLESSSQRRHSLLSSFIFPSAYYYYHRAAATRRAVGGFVPEGGATSMEAAPMLLFSATVMFIMTLYLDVIYPGDGRRGMNFGFPFYWRYWRWSPETPLYESDDFMKEIILFEDFQESPKDSKKDPKKAVEPQEKLCTIQLEGVCKYLHGQWIVNRVTMKTFWDEVTILYGPRGSGGQELLELIAGRMKPDHGEVKATAVQGGGKQSISLATAPCLVPNLTVKELTKWVTRIRGEQEDIETEYMMEDLSLKAVENTKVCDLNVTQKQLLNLLLAFLGDSDIILLDEPTINCSPGVRNSMHAFIMARKMGRTIIISTYDPLDAEIGDSVAFLSYGHLISLGSVKSIREKYIDCVNLNVWPSGNFDKYQRMLVQKVIDGHIPAGQKKCSWELMPNESMHFLVPSGGGVPYHRIIEDLDAKRVELGVKYFELQRQNMQDAYFNCIRKAEHSDDMDVKVLAVPLETQYKEPRARSAFPELGCMIQMRLSYIRANLFGYISSVVVTSLLLTIACLLVLNYRQTAQEIEIGPGMLAEGLGGSSRLFSSLEMRQTLPSSVEKAMDLDYKELISGGLLYSEPPIVAGVFKEKKSGLFHLYSMKLLRFSNMLAQNMFINSAIDSPSDSQVVHTWIEGAESTRWDLLERSKDEEDTVPGLNLSGCQLAAIVVRQWKGAMIVGGVIAIMLAKASMQVAKMANDNCLRMLFLSGARPFPFWLSLSLVDISMFLIAFVLSLPVLALVADMAAAGLGMATLLSLLAFITFLPFVYCCALRCQDALTAYSTFLLLFGTFAVLPGALLIFLKQYGSALEEWCRVMVVFSFLCPPLAASLGSAIANDLVNVQKRSSGEAFAVVWPLILGSCVHVWLWFILVILNSSLVKRLWTQIKFKYEEITIDPNSLGDGVNNDVNIRVTEASSGASAPEASSDVQRNPGGLEDVLQKRTVAGKQAEYTTLALVEKIRAANVAPQQEPSQAEVKQAPDDVGHFLHGPEVLIQNLKTKMIGLWETRDQKGSKDPVIDFSTVRVGHFKDKTHTISMSLFDSQSLNLFGDLPEVRSSLLDMAAGQSYPKKGAIRVKGKRAGLASKCGYVPKDDRLCSFLTGRGTLELVARLKKYKNVRDVVNYLLQVTELEDIADVFVENYGVSDRRMLQFAMAIVDKPTVLILDELDMYVSPTRMKTIWAIACFLRDNCQVPILFSTPRVWECETTSSHTVMLYQGAVSLAETTLDIKKRFSLLATLTITMKKNMDMDMVQQVIIAQLECQPQPHPHPEKLSFLLSIAPGKYVETVTRVRSLMGTIGMNDYQLDTPDLDIIYHANFTSYVFL